MTRRARSVIGLPPERLTLEERWALVGQWIALERYDPQTLPLRNIAALGPSALACAAELKRQGLDPTQYEYVPLDRPY